MKKYSKNIGIALASALIFVGCNSPQPTPTPDPIPPDDKVVQADAVKPSLEESLKKLFAQNHGKTVEDITLIITENDETHVRGTISIAPGGSENSGLFLALKTKEVWKIVYEGNAAVSCKEMEKFGFTESQLNGICDPQPLTQPSKETSVSTMIVKVYFNNPEIDPNWDFECSNVLAVERTIPKTESVAAAALTELLKGPTDAEKAKGYVSNINADVKIQGITIKDSVAKVDFNDQLQYQAGGSCKTSAIIAQITQTLKQFSSVKEVVISINGQTEDILQP
ncbi:GerMN domain-containing protein [Candidatus Gracilibacteria bacterium]|nr:GerMN domain-containing protein [Candidatus Gracilibacteria bacterium]